jgi:Domain of unknown function (DUF4082)/PEP-CTERM motif
MKTLAKASIVAAIALVTPIAAHAASAYEFATAPISFDSQLSLGFAFTTNSAFSVTHLGYFDHLGDGFLTDHEVGIFDTAGTLLVSTLLGSGTGDALSGHFRYKSISPFALAAGQNYVIAATTYGPSDPWAYGNTPSTITGFTVDPSISISSNASLYNYQGDNILRKPGFSIGYTVYAGPNFLSAAIPGAVPEPASWALMFGGFGLVGAAMRRRQRSVTVTYA